MRKHVYTYLTAAVLFVFLMMGNLQVFAAETEKIAEIDRTAETETTEVVEKTAEIEEIAENEMMSEQEVTIVLDETLLPERVVPADLKWKTEQDKGQWIEDMGIADDASSLILVINNLDKEDPEAIPTVEQISPKRKHEWYAQQKRVDGKSRLLYFSKGMDEEWAEVFSVDCYISGGEWFEKTDLYGEYEAISAFGLCENPGSLLPYKTIAMDDYWSLNPESEDYGSIFSIEKTYEKPVDALNLQGMKAYSNYGLILNPNEEESSKPVLMINCQQTESNHDMVSGIQMPQEHLRMLIQSIDSETKFMIIGSLSDLEVTK